MVVESRDCSMTKGRIRFYKPHFFKPVLPGSSLGPLIPRGFIKYLDGEKCEGKAILNSSNRGKSWCVKVKGLKFQKGWNDFVKDHNLHVGDFLVFRYEGGMVFNVMVFDVSACEREYPPLDFKENDELKENKKQVGMKQGGKNIEGSVGTAEVIQVEESSSSAPKHPQFTANIKYYNIRDSFVYIPVEFVRSNGLEDRCCPTTLLNHKGRSWEVMLRVNKGNSQICIRGGFREFSVANNIKIGDVCTFKLLSTGLKPVMEVTISHLNTT